MDKYKEFVRWNATAPDKRVPKTKEEFLDKIGVKLEDAKKYAKKSTYQKDLIKETLRWSREQFPGLIHSMYKTAEDTGQLKAIEAFMDNVKDVEEEGEKIEDIISITQFSDGQRRQIIERMSGGDGFDRPRGKKKYTDVQPDSGSDLHGKLASRTDSGKTGGSLSEDAEQPEG